MTARLLVAAAFVLIAGRVDVFPQPKPFEILDNSFLVEEAFNQEKRDFQNIFNWTRNEDGGWDGSFTQEWPAPTMTHQLSYTIPFVGGGPPAHIGGALVNYRYQALPEGAGRPALSPRISGILPTGREVDGSNHPGVQVNVPVSKQVGSFYLHGNAGFTWIHAVPVSFTERTNLTSPLVAGSLIWNTKPLLNLMLESVVEFEDRITPSARTRRERIVTVSPGFRGGWNLGDKQIIVGGALPITRVEGESTVAVLMYFSYELPFSANR